MKGMKKQILILISAAAMLISACLPAAGLPAVQAETVKQATVDPDAPVLPAAATPEPQPTPTPALDPLSLEALTSRTYGDGDFTVDRLWYSYDRFDRYYVIYDSDDLTIHGYVNVPNGEGPYPVIIMLHGYIPPEEYVTLDYTTRYADNLAQNGYIVLHPNMRNFPPSSTAERRRDNNTGYTIDVLNLLAYLREMAGKEGIFETADISRIGIWGHSIGGSIAMRTLSAEPETFKAAVLYGAVSQRNGNVLDGSGLYDFTDVETPVSIHHGENDEVIRVEQSEELCSQLRVLGKDPECYFYEGQPHTFYRDQWADPLFMERTLEFFDKHVKDNPAG